MTDLGGGPLDFAAGRRLLRNVGMLGSNGLLHAAWHSKRFNARPERGLDVDQ